MEWTPLQSGGGFGAHGRSRSRYAVTEFRAANGEIAGVRLARWPESAPYHDAFAEAAAVMRSVIDIPLGRGPGRPAGEHELAALYGVAMMYAKVYELGEDLPGYPEWQHEPAVPAEGVAAMVFLGPSRKRFACPGCRANVFTRHGDIFVCNGCGEQYAGEPALADDPYAITYLGGGTDGRAHC